MVKAHIFVECQVSHVFARSLVGENHSLSLFHDEQVFRIVNVTVDLALWQILETILFRILLVHVYDVVIEQSNFFHELFFFLFDN